MTKWSKWLIIKVGLRQAIGLKQLDLAYRVSIYKARLYLVKGDSMFMKDLRLNWNNQYLNDQAKLLNGKCIIVSPPLKVATKADLRQRELIARSTI